MTESKQYARHIYSAEDQVQWSDEATGLIGDVRIARTWVQEITASAWWQRHCPAISKVRVETSIQKSAARAGLYQRGGLLVPMIRIRATALRYERAGAYQEWRVVRTDPNACVVPKWVVLHELAHCVVPMANHGPEWQLVFVHLVREYISRDDALLLALSFHEANKQTPAPSSRRRES